MPTIYILDKQTLNEYTDEVFFVREVKGSEYESFQGALTLLLLDLFFLYWSFHPAGITLNLPTKGTNEQIVCIYQWLERLLKAWVSLQFK